MIELAKIANFLKGICFHESSANLTEIDSNIVPTSAVTNLSISIIQTFSAKAPQ